MTLCVAAVTGWNDGGRDPKIVVASDWRVETRIAGAEIQEKLTWLSKEKWAALMSADDMTRAVELIRVCSNHFDKTPTDSNDVGDVIKRAVSFQKRNLIEEYVSSNLGISYDYFLQNGKQQLSEQTHREVELGIRRIRLECQLLLCTFLGREPVIFQIDNDGSVSYQEHFAAIGSGSFIAHAALFQRRHESRLPLGQGIYHVFEAMKLGAIAPGVGSDFAVSVLSRHKANGKLGVEAISETGWRYLERQYKKLGPKPFYRLAFPMRYLESWR